VLTFALTNTSSSGRGYRHVISLNFKKQSRKLCTAYRMAGLPMTLSEAEGNFCCYKSLQTHIT